MPITNGAHKTSFLPYYLSPGFNINSSDGFIAKFTSNGRLLWCTYFGGNGNDNIADVSVDSLDNIYIIGSTSSLEGIATPEVHQEQIWPGVTIQYTSPIYINGEGVVSGFLSKFDKDGRQLWGTYYGYGNGSFATSLDIIKIDSLQNPVFIGYSKDTLGISSPGAYAARPCDTCETSLMLVKFNASGRRTWGTYYPLNIPLSATESGYGEIGGALYISGTDIFVGGKTNSDGFGTPGVYKQHPTGNSDVFLAKFNNAGQRSWHTYIGGNGSELMSLKPLAKINMTIFISEALLTQLQVLQMVDWLTTQLREIQIDF